MKSKNIQVLFILSSYSLLLTVVVTFLLTNLPAPQPVAVGSPKPPHYKKKSIAAEGCNLQKVQEQKEDEQMDKLRTLVEQELIELEVKFSYTQEAHTKSKVARN